MSALIKRLLLASALVLGLAAGVPALAQEEAEGTEQIEPIPPEETGEEAAPEEGQGEEAPEAPAPEEAPGEAPEEGAE